MFFHSNSYLIFIRGKKERIDAWIFSYTVGRNNDKSEIYKETVIQIIEELTIKIGINFFSKIENKTSSISYKTLTSKY